MKLAIFLFLISLLARLSMIHATGFGGLYGQDPFAYLDYSHELRQALATLQFPPPFFWPLGYPLLVVLGTLAAGSEHAAGQMVSVIAGALVAPLVYLIVLELRPAARVGAIVAGLLAAFSAQLMFSSLSVMSDAAALLWITLSAWAMLRYGRGLSPRWLALSAFALGLAVLTRWVYALAALTWVVSILSSWRASRFPWRKAALLAALSILIAGLPMLLQLLPGALRGELSHIGDLRVYGWNPTNAFRSTIANADGLFQYERPMGLFYASPIVHPAFVFPLMLPFLLIGLWQAVRLDRPQALLILAWPLTFYIFLAGVTWQNPRFSLAFYPPLLAITALGIQYAWDRTTYAARSLPPATRSLPRVTCYLLISLVALALSGALARSFRDVGAFARWNQSRIDAAAWTEAQLPAGATLVTFDLTATLNHYTKQTAEEIYTMDPLDVTTLRGGASPFYLLLDLGNIETQWRGKSPHTNYEWLHGNRKLTEIGRFPPYTLFRVDAR